MKNHKLLEISDEIVSFDEESLQRKPVLKKDVIDKFIEQKDFYAVKIVDSMPEMGGVLEEKYVDNLFIRIHCELQQISEEFQHGQRVAELLNPLVKSLIVGGVKSPIRIVDIGCGTGYVLRWLASYMNMEHLQLIGMDYNAVLIKEAKRLAQLENLDVQFIVADAFHSSEPAHIYISTGVIHHFRDNYLETFFTKHNRPETKAFCHFDFQPSIFSLPGAWMIHLARVREPICFHDGIVSAKRAHTAKTLMNLGKSLPFATTMYSSKIWFLPISRAMHTFLGVEPFYKEEFIKQLGKRSKRLGDWQ